MIQVSNLHSNQRLVLLEFITRRALSNREIPYNQTPNLSGNPETYHSSVEPTQSVSTTTFSDTCLQ